MRENRSAHEHMCSVGTEGAEMLENMNIGGVEGADTLEHICIWGAEGAEPLENMYLCPLPPLRSHREC